MPRFCKKDCVRTLLGYTNQRKNFVFGDIFLFWILVAGIFIVRFSGSSRLNLCGLACLKFTTNLARAQQIWNKLRLMIHKRIQNRSSSYPLKSMVPIAYDVLQARAHLFLGVSTILNFVPLKECNNSVMDMRRFNREPSKQTRRTTSLQKQVIRPIRPEPVKAEPIPDLTELMNDWFFGASTKEIKAVNITKEALFLEDVEEEEEEEEEVGGQSPKNITSKLTQEWLEEAKRVVASSPSRGGSPTRLVGSPRFGSSGVRDFDRRDPLSRSARRHRSIESFSNEILSKSAMHSRNRSESFDPQPTSGVEISPASAVQQWFSNILKPHTPTDNSKQITPQENQPEQTAQTKQPRQPIRKSRFRDVPTAPQSIPSRRTFKPPAAPPALDMQILSPPKNLIESTHRRSISVSTCSLTDNKMLSPPRNLVEPAHRRSISSSTCSLDKIANRLDSEERLKEGADGARDLNAFLKEQGSKVKKISNGEINGKAKIVLSGSSNSTSSMVAAICYAWLLESRIKEKKEDGGSVVVVPVMNMRRGRMWKQRQVAWLFHHFAIDATSLLFSDEVDLENLMMVGKLSLAVVGQDILQTNNEVGSQCTILTDNFCEDAYDLLQIPVVKKLLLAGILLDTKNLNKSTKFSMNRDSEAVQLLQVGSAPNYRNDLFDQLMQDQRDSSFLEAMRHNYGKPPSEIGGENGVLVDQNVTARKSTSTAYQGIINAISDKKSNDVKTVQKPAAKSKPLPAPAPVPASRAKNKFSIAKWFGFGSKE